METAAATVHLDLPSSPFPLVVVATRHADGKVVVSAREQANACQNPRSSHSVLAYDRGRLTRTAVPSATEVSDRVLAAVAAELRSLDGLATCACGALADAGVVGPRAVCAACAPTACVCGSDTRHCWCLDMTTTAMGWPVMDPRVPNVGDVVEVRLIPLREAV